MGVQAEEHLEKHFFKRLTRLFMVRRFVGSWIALLILLAGIVSLQLQGLSGYYQELQPISGGTYTEGVVGTFTNASPLYATGLVDASVSKLVFAGLLKYNAQNKLVGDLAESWKSSEDDKAYTVTLKPNLKWHDGEALTAEDVVFTFQTIQNPDAKSPLFRAWQNVTIQAVDARTVTFRLKSPLAPFVYSLTTGIVPKHSLASITAAQLRSAPFNTMRPVGAGPFQWETIETLGSTETTQQNIGLKAFADYHNGAPKLQQFVIKTFGSEAPLISSFQKQEINGLVGLDRMPDALSQIEEIKEYSIPLTAESLAFLRTDSELLKDTKVRQALVQAIHVPTIVNGLSYPAIIADAPLLRGQVGYNPNLRQLATNVEQAKKLLDEAGWKEMPNEKVRVNGSKKLNLKLFAQNNPDHAHVTGQLQKAWQAIGVETQVTLPSEQDLQSVINDRTYDVLVYGISIGADPDVFAYWHSTQSDLRAASRLNFANYQSTTADRALEGGRTRVDANLRGAKYVPFLEAWRADAPAIALYQPRFLYITRGQLFGFDQEVINAAAERFNNVQNWMIRQGQTVKPL